MKLHFARPCFAAFALAATVLLTGSFPPVSAQTAAPPAMTALAPLPSDAPYADEINAFGAADKQQMPPTGAVLFIGSSSIRYWTSLASDFPEIPVINRGFGGSLIQDSTRYAGRIGIPYRPKIIILCAGTNDLAYGGKDPQQVLQEYQDFVQTIHTALPDTRIVYLAINPTVARWKQESRNLETNYLIEMFTVKTNSPTEKLNFIDPHTQLLTADDQPQPLLLRSDGLHFNADGYKVWKSLIKPRILALAAMDGVKLLDTPQANGIESSSAQQQEHQEWVGHSFEEMQTIKPGMTRGDLEKVFVGEGGFHQSDSQTYLYRGCLYFKVTVNFQLAGSALEYPSNPKDKIVSITQPYINTLSQPN